MVCIGVFCGVVGASWNGASGATSGSFIFYRPTSTELIQKRCRPSVSSTRLVAGIWFFLICSERLSSTLERQECTSSGRSWNESELREEKADHYFFFHHLNVEKILFWVLCLTVLLDSVLQWKAIIIIFKLIFRYGLKKDVRESLYDACNKWTSAVKSTPGPFMGGSKPDLADLVSLIMLGCLCCYLPIKLWLHTGCVRMLQLDRGVRRFRWGSSKHEDRSVVLRSEECNRRK